MVTATKTGERRPPGRPRKYGQGRINATVRFTPERYAIVKGLADAAGRSFSEQVEHIVEQHFAEAAFKAAARLDANVRALSEARVTEIVEATVARLLAGRDDARSAGAAGKARRVRKRQDAEKTSGSVGDDPERRKR